MNTSNDSCQTSQTERNGSPSSGQQSHIASTQRPSTSRSVKDCFYAHEGRRIDKWAHYFPVYERYFRQFVDTPVKLLEIGVDHGGSLQLWKEYFGPQSHIYGIDIRGECVDYSEGQIQIFCRDQSKPEDLKEFAQICGPFDIVIDDGSHVLSHQETSFRALWPQTNHIYLIEDCHGEYPLLPASADIKSMGFYRSLMVLEKGQTTPKRVIRGNPSRELNSDEIAASRLYSA